MNYVDKLLLNEYRFMSEIECWSGEIHLKFSGMLYIGVEFFMASIEIYSFNFKILDNHLWAK